MKLKINSYKLLVACLAIITSIIPFVYNNQKEATYLSLLLIIFILIFYKFLLNNRLDFDIKIRKEIIILFLISFTIISQNIYLNFETIDWDVASYLVASQDLANGNLPNQEQWESKGPILFYLYYFLLLCVGKNFIYFKLINDFLVALSAIFLYLIIYNTSNRNNLKSIFSGLLFLLLMAQPWAVGEYSETYSLLFISLAYYLMIKLVFNKNKYLFVGALLATSTLINQGTIIFIFPILHYIFLDKQFKNLKKRFIDFIVAVVAIHLLFLILYAYNSILNIYITTYIQIPLGYIQSNYSNLYELKVFFRRFYETYHPLYFALLSIFVLLVLQILLNFKTVFSFLNDWIITFIFTTLLFYYLGSHNYYHHLIFFLFGVSLLIVKIPNPQSFLIYIFILLGSILLILQDGNQSISNLKNTETLYSEYPLKQLSEEIELYFQDDYTILALDHTLILYYLNKPNYTYIVHPSNHSEKYIVKTLTDLGRIEMNYLNNILLYENPDVILCSSVKIVKGVPTENPLFNCSVNDYRKDYLKLDTEKYEQNPNLAFYKDPYRKINVYIRKSS